jgi:nitroreductase
MEKKIMDLVEAINKRKSIRAFKPDPVSPDLLRKIIEQALRAPSWANTQPWEFVIVTGKQLKEIQKGFLERGEQEPTPEVARPYEFPEPYLSRVKALAPKGKTPTKEDMDARRVRNFEHYGAPAVIYLLVGRPFFYQEKGINAWSLYDSGAVVQNIMLLATSHGLGTVAQAQAVVYPDIIRKVIDIPESKVIALGIAIGYPDWDDPVTQIYREREPLEKVATWVGFD